MSLAINAAPFNYDESNDSEYINVKKRSAHNKTQKKNIKENFESSERFDKNKVNSVLETIHNKMSEMEDDNELGDFNPPPKPESAGVMKTVATEQMQNMLNSSNSKNMNNNAKFVGLPPASYDSGDLELNNYMNNYGNVKTAEEYYRKMLPPQFQNQNQNQNQRKPQYNPYYNNNNNNSFPENSSNDVLLKKINYMINLLEEQKDERTNNVTEEVVLYSFLGIFVIFVVDSFAKVGKYVR
jgi:hypothetical protein